MVFVGPYEHHSNELPWRESIADVVVDRRGRATATSTSSTCARSCASTRDRPLRIGSFSAASNVTGILSDTDAIAALLHRHGALAFWDYAAAGAVRADPDGESAPGRGTTRTRSSSRRTSSSAARRRPGVLVVRRELVRNAVPDARRAAARSPSSTRTAHRYLDDPVAREEGGTPAIVESIRAGLVFALKEAVGTDRDPAREERLWCQRRVQRWRRNPQHRDPRQPRRATGCPIVSFRIRHAPVAYLHHNFVVAVLNDLFGIQARGGCSCAGPYGHRLLGIDAERSRAIRARDRPRLRGDQAGLGRGSTSTTSSPTPSPTT